MQARARAFGLGLLVWLLPFVVAFLVFPFRESWRALFESVMAVSVTVTAVWFGLVYLRRLPVVAVQDGVLVGVLWWLMCVAIDLPLFSAGPMTMTLGDYMADIGLTYVSIPAVTIGLAVATARPTRR